MDDKKKRAHQRADEQRTPPTDATDATAQPKHQLAQMSARLKTLRAQRQKPKQ